ncbi:MAG TPA: undecaprenyl-diphosphate phosphatase [Treponemataceae bacterium]|nr:undecaprenyl-diphosphate phosphatase [Treponemataceae bacterium]
MLEMLKVIVLGIVEGITEWLPISSTGHMLLVDAVMPLKMTPEFKEMFFVVIQFGAILAVVCMYWSRMWPVGIKDKKPFVKMDIITMWLKILVALIPSIVFGLLLDEWLEEHLYTPNVIAIMLIFYGVLFIIIERWNKNRTPLFKTMDDIGWKTGLFIGLFQVLAMVPGTSRSGATIIGGLLLGASRIAAAEFTFFLAVPTMLGASLLKLVKFGISFTSVELLTLVVGMVVAFAVSIFAIKFLMNFIKKHDFTAFGWYRIVLGAIVLFVSWYIKM